MDHHSPFKLGRKSTKRQRSIAVAIELQCYVIPARWEVSPLGVLSYSPLPLGRIAIDPWQVRETLVNLRRDTQQIIDFLNAVGSWDLMPSTSIDDYWDWQDILKTVLMQPKNWRTSASIANRDKIRRLSSIPNHHLTLDSSGDFKRAIFSCTNPSALDAIIASVHLDDAKLQRRIATHLRMETNKPASRRPRVL